MMNINRFSFLHWILLSSFLFLKCSYPDSDKPENKRNKSVLNIAPSNFQIRKFENADSIFMIISLQSCSTCLEELLDFYEKLSLLDNSKLIVTNFSDEEDKELKSIYGVRLSKLNHVLIDRDNNWKYLSDDKPYQAKIFLWEAYNGFLQKIYLNDENFKKISQYLYEKYQ